jgi:hypothetical protein|tara:strand:+ start:618 stop:863 length:246 start_codon:yes stop_codon:yes gene_type:complete
MVDASLETVTKTKLAKLVQELESTIVTNIADMEPREVDYILENFTKYLTYDLKRNFSEAREKNLKESPFDEIINNDLDFKL